MKPAEVGNIFIKQKVEYLLLGKGRLDKMLKDGIKLYLYFILFHDYSVTLNKSWLYIALELHKVA